MAFDWKGEALAGAGLYVKLFQPDIHPGSSCVDHIPFGTSTSAATIATTTIVAFIHPSFDYGCSYFLGLIAI